MSGFHTHMLIGAAGGLAAYKVTEYLAPSILSPQISVDTFTITVPSTAIAVTAVAVSSVAALWPDLDKSDSFISHVANHTMWLACGLLGLVVAYLMAHSILWLVVGTVVGAIVGFVAGRPILGVLRVVSGGHRRLTHSLLVGIGLLFGAWVFYLLDLTGISALLVIVVWGQFLHLAGDVVTPGGVALFFPIWPGPIHLFPFWISQFGELAAGCISVLLCVAMIWFWGFP